MNTKAFGCIFCLLIAAMAFCPCAYGKRDFLRQGIEQYRQENYEEAVELLVRAREAEPGSSSAAFFLGLAYKQVIDYGQAAKHLRDSVSLQPRIKEALVELVEVLYRMPGEEPLKEADKWLRVAEREDIFPAKTAFLRGLILHKKGRNLEAISSFERAKALDESMTQASDFQIALCYIKEKDLEKARARFQSVVLFDPQSDLSGFARRYQDMIDRQMERERPFHLTLGVFGQYDTNVVLKPLGPTFASDITEEESYVTTTTLRADYTPSIEGPWLFNGQYRFFGNFHDRHATTHDAIGNGISLAPGYSFERSALNLAVNYDHVLLRQPSYKAYAGYLRTGPLYRVLAARDHLIEVFSGYMRNRYYRDLTDEREDRDADGIAAYVSWIWTFKKDAFLNLRYEFQDDDTEGLWWENHGHHVSLNTTLPLTDKVDLQLSGGLILQDYKNNHILLSDLDSRDDTTYQGTVGLTWEFFKRTRLVAQYTKIRADSNIEIYDYKRSLYSLGIEYRY